MGRQALQEDGVRGGMAVMAAIEARYWAVETNARNLFYLLPPSFFPSRIFSEYKYVLLTGLYHHAN
jgi:hypothetical protein